MEKPQGLKASPALQKFAKSTVSKESRWVMIEEGDERAN
jgi:hypothetical protein